MSLRNPASAEARALEEARPDLLRVVSGLKVTNRQQQAVDSWGQHSKASTDRERSKLVAEDMGISVSAAQQLLTRVGILQTKPGADRRAVMAMFQARQRARTNGTAIVLLLGCLDGLLSVRHVELRRAGDVRGLSRRPRLGGLRSG